MTEGSGSGEAGVKGGIGEGGVGDVVGSGKGKGEAW